MSVEPFPRTFKPRVPASDAGRRAAVHDSLAVLASSVGVAACWGPDGVEGVLVRSVMRVSVTPPRFLVSIDKAAGGHKALLAADTIGLSILAAGQDAATDAFLDAGAGWSGGGWSEAADEPPTLRGALTALSGRVRSRIDAGSHTLLILDLDGAESRGGAPLVCFDQS
jgi:flavin reductase (DIM6/NTAB) family NADH-FMN oxidoreductase RutF